MRLTSQDGIIPHTSHKKQNAFSEYAGKDIRKGKVITERSG
jgi:hypothetical protein